MTENRQVSALALAAAAVAAFGAFGGRADAQTIGQPQRFGSHYQQFATNSCDTSDSTPCTVAFSTMTRGPLKVMKASCTILTSEGGSPSKEVTGAVLGRLSDNQKNFIAGQYLAPMQSEFAGPGQIVLNFLVDTLWVIPNNWRPAIQISRLNAPPVAASCSVSGEELEN
ncbi:hypothetical protein [Chenggangzhangella methanolivorans]|uniref:Uncharacterized protein n=1 Tax=Chenggangzhangella methanolivorans TaxID=1437009 RepID=A0A9E6RES6_9HYPH|nr:hypothetical protein [Chenggangzhangella methanolivorans]QZN99885.1 hypothetical protein K6K41_25125 [Chenggangzhangella methanolivorans]